MTTIATTDVHAALERAAEQLRSAGGPDGVVRRRDIRTRLLALEGAERELVDVLYRFIDGRDAARSARVTKADIDATVAFIRTGFPRRGEPLRAHPGHLPRRARLHGRQAGARDREVRGPGLLLQSFPLYPLGP